MRIPRVAGLALILAVGVFSLPLAALPFEGSGDENAILPLQVGGMTLFGALMGLALRVAEGSTRRRAVLGGLLGVGGALLGGAVFFVLLGGVSGA